MIIGIVLVITSAIMGVIWQANWNPESYFNNVEAVYPYLIGGIAITATIFIGLYLIYVSRKPPKEQ